MMRIRPISTRLTLLLAAIVLLTPLIAGEVIGQPAPKPQSLCIDSTVCMDAANVSDQRLTNGPDFRVHSFTMKDGTKAGVYLGGFPQRPSEDAKPTTETIDGVACERFDAEGVDGRELTFYCPKWAGDGLIIHAWATSSDPTARTEAMQAAALLKSMRHCATAECA